MTTCSSYSVAERNLKHVSLLPSHVLATPSRCPVGAAQVPPKHLIDEERVYDSRQQHSRLGKTICADDR